MPNYRRIGRPSDVHSVRSARDYLAYQAAVITKNRREHPAILFPEPHVSVRPPVQGPHIRQGRWVVVCECSCGLSYDPEWQLACCMLCGAIYQGLIAPEPRDRVERLLMQRPQFLNRNWMPGEPVSDLVFENLSMGCEAPS